jgi:hypothetical protein
MHLMGTNVGFYCRIGPTLFTRVTNRSFSLEDLKSLMQAHIHDDQRKFEGVYL